MIYDPEYEDVTFGIDLAGKDDFSMVSTNDVITFYPPSIGHWKLHEGDISFHITHGRPNFIVRFCTKFLLGWTWVDA